MTAVRAVSRDHFLKLGPARNKRRVLALLRAEKLEIGGLK